MTRAPAVPLARLSRIGALVGALGMAALAALQLASAGAADMLWTLDDPWRSLWIYPLFGASVGALASVPLEGLRRLVAAGVAAEAFTAGGLCLLAYAGRSLATVGLRARQGFPGGRPLALALAALAVVALAALAIALLQRRMPRGGRGGPPVRTSMLVRDAWLLGCPPLAAVLFTHTSWLAIKEQAAGLGLLGAPALALCVLSGALGLALGAALLRRPDGAPAGLRRGAACVLLLAGLAFGLESQRPARIDPAHGDGAAGGPHVLLIVLDTLRRDAVSAYGMLQGSTPRLDALAAQGVRFEDVLANGSWTVPSHASLFTGAQVSRHGAGHFRRRLRERPGGAGSARLTTLAERFADAGWLTAGFVCNMNVSHAAGFDRGFASWQEVWRAGQGDYDVLDPAARAWLGLGVFDKGGELATRGVTDWLRRRADDEQPWLLFVNLMESHSPFYQAPERFARRWLSDGEPSAGARALIADPMAHVYRAGVEPALAEELWRVYLGGVLYQDWLLGRILDALEASGQADDTLVVVTSDHGEHFGGQGLLGHGQDLDDDLLAVPLVMRGPGLGRGAVDATPASLVDLLPTLLSLCGLDVPRPEPGRDGLVIAGPGRAEGPGLAERPRLVEQHANFLGSIEDYRALTAAFDEQGGELRWAWPRAAIDRGGVRYVEVESPEPGAWPRGLSRAPAGRWHPPLDDGRTPVDDEALRAELSTQLHALRSAWVRASDPGAGEGPDLDDETREQLRKLGYLGGR